MLWDLAAVRESVEESPFCSELPVELFHVPQQQRLGLVLCGETPQCPLPPSAAHPVLEEGSLVPVVSQPIVVLLLMEEELKRHLEECLS